MAVVYLDTSALVKLCVHESGTPLAVALWEGADVLATSAIADTEIRSVIATGERIGRIDAAPAQQALGRWEELKDGIHYVTLSRQVRESAAALVAKWPLRAADATHLASAMLFKDAPNLLIAAWDRRLAAAARGEGLTVLPPAVS